MAVLIVASAIIIGTSGESVLVRYLGVLWTIFFVVCLYREAQRVEAPR
jgi:hypothetical protein